MTRLRASITSLRSREMSPSWPAGSGWDTLRGELVSSLILICLGNAWVGPEHPMERTLRHLSCWGAGDLPAGRLPLVVRLQEMEHQPKGKQVSAYRQLPLALRVDLGVGQGVPVLEHHRDGSCHLEPETEREVCRGRVGLVGDALPGAGVQRVPDPSPSIEGYRLSAHQHRVQREHDGNGLDLEVAARDPVAIHHVPDLDLEMEVVVVLVPEGGQSPWLHDLVRGPLLGQVIAVAGNDPP